MSVPHHPIKYSVCFTISILIFVQLTTCLGLDLATDIVNPNAFDLDQDFISVDKTVISILKDLKDENGDNTILNMIREKSPNIFSKINGIYSAAAVEKPIEKQIEQAKRNEVPARISKYSWIDSAVEEFLPRKKLSFDTIKNQFTNAITDEEISDDENNTKIKDILKNIGHTKPQKRDDFSKTFEELGLISEPIVKKPFSPIFESKGGKNLLFQGSNLQTTQNKALSSGIVEKENKEEEIRGKIRRLLYGG